MRSAKSIPPEEASGYASGLLRRQRKRTNGGRVWLAGYLLPAEQWAKFSDDWLAALHEKPRIEYFKVSDAFRGDGQFGVLGSEFRMAKVRDLLSVIHKYDPQGIASFTTWEGFLAFSRSLPPPLDKQLYAPLFLQLIDNVLRWQQASNRFPEKVQLDFDDQGTAGAFAIEWYGRLMHGTPPFCFSDDHKAILEGTPRMLNDRQIVPLQAADMLAGVIRTAPPDQRHKGWEWLYDEIFKTVWDDSRGFGKQTWRQIKGIVLP